MGLLPGARKVQQQLVAEPRAGDLEAAGRERQRRMARGVSYVIHRPVLIGIGRPLIKCLCAVLLSCQVTGMSLRSGRGRGLISRINAGGVIASPS